MTLSSIGRSAYHDRGQIDEICVARDGAKLRPSKALVSYIRPAQDDRNLVVLELVRSPDIAEMGARRPVVASWREGSSSIAMG
jgi:hypothetical protein